MKSITTPSAYLACAQGGLDAVCDRLTGLQQREQRGGRALHDPRADYADYYERALLTVQLLRSDTEGESWTRVATSSVTFFRSMGGTFGATVSLAGVVRRPASVAVSDPRCAAAGLLRAATRRTAAPGSAISCSTTSTAFITASVSGSLAEAGAIGRMTDGATTREVEHPVPNSAGRRRLRAWGHPTRAAPRAEPRG